MYTVTSTASSVRTARLIPLVVRLDLDRWRCQTSVAVDRRIRVTRAPIYVRALDSISYNIRGMVVRAYLRSRSTSGNGRSLSTALPTASCTGNNGGARLPGVVSVYPSIRR